MIALPFLLFWENVNPICDDCKNILFMRRGNSGMKVPFWK